MRFIHALLLFLLPGLISGAEAADDRQVDALKREINRHDELYFREARPAISDSAYDALKEELARLEGERDCASQAVGQTDERTGRHGQHLHRVPMLSLRKARTVQDISAFHWDLADLLGTPDLDYALEPKVDGIAVSAVYEEGRLTRVLSRGNGEIGEDLTANFLALGILPPQLPQDLQHGPQGQPPAFVELRGEAFIPWERFHRLNMQRRSAGQAAFTDPRSLASGTARLGDPAVAVERGLAVVLFGWGAWEPADTVPESHMNFRERLMQWGLPVLQPARVVRGREALLETVGEMMAQHKDWPFACDGIVIKLNQTRDRRTLGVDSTGPRWALAIKPVPERVETVLTAIRWQTGATGKLTPVAELEPVQISGRTIRRASLHNADYVIAGDYRVGDTVYLELAGGIIPQLLGVKLEQRPDNSLPPDIPQASR